MKKEYDKLKRLHASNNETVLVYEKEIKRLNAAITLLLEEKQQWTESKTRWNEIVLKTITSGNEATAKINEEIQTLINENRKLREETKTIREGLNVCLSQ